ncbi:hypothetical protein [Leisingera sp. ANG-Vp]|uniref:hypothetical protein n=1 Tax=Leisingera sp. ANG-Vp TaxID=1577896 RepID=UPI00057CBECF|nr:hypothetical protein [Leisingera sp. ANG-Vp]KIC20968.1 hypothetical protein RA20_06865 [Leisingera sp. ANG-Vp]
MAKFKNCFLSAVCAAAVASTAQAEISGISYTATGFPEGTECGARNTDREVKIKSRKKRGKLMFTFKMKEGALEAEFFCKLPDGEVITLNGHKNLPEWAQGRASITESYNF